LEIRESSPITEAAPHCFKWNIWDLLKNQLLHSRHCDPKRSETFEWDKTGQIRQNQGFLKLKRQKRAADHSATPVATAQILMIRS